MHLFELYKATIVFFKPKLLTNKHNEDTDGTRNNSSYHLNCHLVYFGIDFIAGTSCFTYIGWPYEDISESYRSGHTDVGIIAIIALYDKTTQTALPQKTTLALAFVMMMNYLAILLYPFIVDFLQWVFHTQSQEFPFIFNLLITIVTLFWACRRRHSFLFNDQLTNWNKKRASFSERSCLFRHHVL